MNQWQPATNLDEVMDLFESTDDVDVNSPFYVQRDENGLNKLIHKLKRKQFTHGFLCGHVGSGKTTELLRLSSDPTINNNWFPLFIPAKDVLKDSTNLTPDALFIGIGLQLLERTTAEQLNRNFEQQLDDWGTTLIKTVVKSESLDAKAGAKANVWVAYFHAWLKVRKEWKTQEKIQFEPKVQDLVNIVDQMAQDLFNNTGKKLLVMLDDLEKGNSPEEKAMHHRLFNEYYSVLVQPRFSIIYTLPIYFRALPDKQLEKGLIYAFSALRIYEVTGKSQTKPVLNKQSPGYLQIKSFIERRLADEAVLFEDGVLDELVLIGGGLFRDTAQAIADAAYYADARGANTVAEQDVEMVFNELKKDYQPSIRGDAIVTLGEVIKQDTGWPQNVEPFLQSRAVMEYENGDVWLDVRYVLKAYVLSLLDKSKTIIT